MVWVLCQQLHLRWPNTVFGRTYVIQRTRKDYKKMNMAFIQQSFYLVNAHAIFLPNWTECIDGFGHLLERYARKGNDAKNRAIPRFFFVTEWTQLDTPSHFMLQKLG